MPGIRHAAAPQIDRERLEIAKGFWRDHPLPGGFETAYVASVVGGLTDEALEHAGIRRGSKGYAQRRYDFQRVLLKDAPDVTGDTMIECMAKTYVWMGTAALTDTRAFLSTPAGREFWETGIGLKDAHTCALDQLYNPLMEHMRDAHLAIGAKPPERYRRPL